MDLLELDERLEKDIKHLEKSLVEYEKLMHEASTLKYAFENQTKELMAAYEEKMQQLNAKFMSDEELSTKSVKSFNDNYYKKVVTLFHDFELKKNGFELYVNKMIEANEENRRSLMKIINDHTVNEKESIEAINTNISEIKSESERSLINLSSELFKETMRAEDKDRKLARNFKIFMAISSVLFIVLLIWR